MRIRLTDPVLDYEGKPLQAKKTNPDGTVFLDENKHPVLEPETLRAYLVTALNHKATAETEPIGAEEAAKRYQLTNKLYAKNEVDLTLAECSLLQARVVAIFDSPLIQGRISDALEGRKIEVSAVDTKANA